MFNIINHKNCIFYKLDNILIIIYYTIMLTKQIIIIKSYRYFNIGLSRYYYSKTNTLNTKIHNKINNIEIILNKYTNMNKNGYNSYHVELDSLKDDINKISKNIKKIKKLTENLNIYKY